MIWRELFKNSSDAEIFAFNDVATLLSSCFEAVLPQCVNQQELRHWILMNDLIAAHSWIELANRKLATAAQE